jgi:predicted dehydrogenase
VDDDHTARTLRELRDQHRQEPALLSRDFREVLDRGDIDAVIVATPDHWHALPTILACEAGKDVYVEKPLSLTIAEGRAMVNAARRHKRVVQIGTQQRSASHYQEAVAYVKSGALGKVRVVRAWAYLDSNGAMPALPNDAPPAYVDYDLWLGPAPKRPFNRNRFHSSFRWFWDYSGGLATDWGAHMIDIASWAMGVRAPSSAASVGGKFGYPDDAMETPDTQHVIWSFPGFSMIWEHALGVGRGPEGREHGVAFHGNDAVLVIDRGGWEVIPETRNLDRMGPRYRSEGLPRQRAREDFHLRHIENFIDCMRSRKQPNSDVEIGHTSMIACHLGNIAQRLGRQVNWDLEKEKVIGDDEAQAHTAPKYRAPWRLPA